MACENELEKVYEASKLEGVQDHNDNRIAFNDVLDSTKSVAQRTAALDRLKTNGFNLTVEALEAWIVCDRGSTPNTPNTQKTDCQNKLDDAFDASKLEGVQDHKDNLKAFNDVLDSTKSAAQRAAALDRLKTNGFNLTVEALEVWLECDQR